MQIGTIAYMPPEQAMGGALDRRTDVFSFGLVLYEMATGRQAFTGDTAAAIFDAILHQTPDSLANINSELPSELEDHQQGAGERRRIALPGCGRNARRSETTEARP